MRLVQLNTWSCKLPTEIITLFNQETPDIVCLQEVVSTRFHGKILGTIEEITDAHPFASHYYTPLVEMAFMHHRITRGNMISSQFPIPATAELWTHGSYTEDFDYLDSGGYNVARNIAHAIVETPHGPVHVLTLHGYHIHEHKQGNDETLRACLELARYAEALDGPVIITGDFNLAPTSESIKVLEKSFRNLSAEYGLVTTRTYLTAKTEVCDYIFVNNAVTVEDFRVSPVIASDHSALVLDFEIIA